MNNNALCGLDPEVKAASKAVERAWPGVIDADDVEQEIWTVLLHSNGSVEELLNMDKGQRQGSLTRIGHQFAAKYRDDYELFSGNVHYGTKEVKDLLERGVLTEERSTLDVERMDVFDGLTTLRVDYASVIAEEFFLGTYQKYSGHARKQLTRAVDALTSQMNKARRRRVAEYTEGPGTRRVISNAKAFAISSNQDNN